MFIFVLVFIFCNKLQNLFVVIQSCKQPECPSRGYWIYKSWYILTMEYCSAIKINELFIHASTCTYLKKFMHSIRSQTLCDSICMKCPQKTFIVIESWWVVAWAWGWKRRLMAGRFERNLGSVIKLDFGDGCTKLKQQQQQQNPKPHIEFFF